jgi:hypothetical protein
LERAALTADRFIPDPFNVEGGRRLYRTGDLGRWRADGTLEYLGRNDDQVKIRGFRIELGEIEAQLMTLVEVKEAAAVVREFAEGDKRLVAYITPREGAFDVQALRAQLLSRLPDYMVPSAFVLIEQGLPRTPNGKLDRRALPAPDVSAYVSLVYEQPEGPIERGLAEIWARLLRVERVGRNHNFFELGGHSLHGMRLMAEVAQKFGVRIRVTSIFEYPTVARMAMQIGKGVGAEDAAPIVHPLEIEEGDI